jgi:hypothetical protein
LIFDLDFGLPAAIAMSTPKQKGKPNSLHRHEFSSKSAIAQGEQITSLPRIPRRALNKKERKNSQQGQQILPANF